VEKCLPDIKFLATKGFRQFYLGMESPQPKLECHRLKAFPGNNKVFNCGTQDLKAMKKEELLGVLKKELKIGEEEQIAVYTHFGMDDSFLPFRYFEKIKRKSIFRNIRLTKK
jgi:hypothetical protein